LNRNKAYILCPAANSSPIYQSWLPFVEHVLVDEYSDQWQPPEDCGIVISHLHYDYPTATILSRLTKQNRVPVLVLADGVLEFRNTYQNPTVAAGSIFMPVHGHKLACIGNSQARVVSSWDNAGKCEIVGLPRFDQLNDIRKKGANSDKQQDPNSFRILVATARKPGFDTRQIETVRRSLMDLKKHFDSTPVIHNKRLEITWRLTGDLEQSIGVNQEPVRVESRQILEVLGQVDAVITTPSTIILESWLLGLPTATLDYTNSPPFVPTAWNITADTHIESTIVSLSSKPESMMLFQSASMDDMIQYRESATERLTYLIQQMIHLGNQCHETQTPISFPDEILPPPESKTIDTRDSSEVATLAKLFPQNHFFGHRGLKVSDAESVATQFDQAQRNIQQLHQRIESYRAELAKARQAVRISDRHYEFVTDQGKWLRGEIQRLQLALRIRNRQTRLERRVRVRSSIAFQKWYFFVTQPQRGSRRIENPFSLDVLFQLTPYPKSNKLPATIENFQKHRRRPPQIKMWKQPPTHRLLRKIKRSATRAKMRVRVLRVARAA